ncbi:MAG: FG-GAP repeat protein [Candidatus Promineifilaceae bacterium]
MKHLLQIFIVVLVVILVVAGRREIVGAAKQTLTGQDALNFLHESGIYNQLTPEAGTGPSPVGREFFQTAQIGATDGYTDDLFGISVARDGDTLLIGVSQSDVEGNSDQGAAYVFTDSSSIGWVLEAKLTADDGAADDQFGFAVALDGDTALVGAYQADIGGSSNQGAAYVFNRAGVFWSQTEKLTANSGSAEDTFGYAVALDGSFALVGAPTEDVNGNVDQGAAYIFSRTGNSWSQQARLITADTVAGDEFGRSVALDGSTALVGAPFEDIGFDEDQGAAYVFTNNNGSWGQEGRLATGDGAGDDQLGGAVALDGNTALVGAHLAAINGNNNQGAAYVYIRNGNSWSQQAKLTADDGAQGDRLGRSVAVEGDTALIGAPMADINGNGNQGAAYVFIRDNDSWSQQSKLTDWTNGEGGDRFGRSVALDGDTALVGAIYSELWFGNPDRGAVYAYERSELAWLSKGDVAAQDGEEDDQFGYAVAVDGDTALIGAPDVEIDGVVKQGVAYIFERSMDNWVQTAKLADMDSTEWRFGFSVALEGNIAVVGTPGVNSVVDLGGAVYIFVRESDNSWIQYDKLTAPVRENRDLFGSSVALDGDTVLVGAPGKDIGGNDDQGAAYVFIRETNSNWEQQARLLAVDGAEDDWFGNSVALDGDTALVGAYTADVEGYDNQGAAYVFTNEEGVWDHQAKLTATDGAVSDWFGISVALEGDTALVGASLADVGGNFNQGAVYAFTRAGSIWSQQAKLVATDGAADDRFGHALALDENVALVGANLTDVGGSFDRGAAYVFVESGSEWRQQTKLTAADGTGGDEFGHALAVQDNTALIGAPSADFNGNDNQGKAYFFERQPYKIFLPMVVNTH